METRQRCAAQAKVTFLRAETQEQRTGVKVRQNMSAKELRLDGDATRGDAKRIWPRTRSRLNTQTQVETMRAGLAITQEAEEWLRAGEGNDQSGDTGKTHTHTHTQGLCLLPRT